MLKYWNISVMLDYCEIDYTEKQVMKLEKLLNSFLKKYIIKIESERDAQNEIDEILRKQKELDECNEDTDFEVKQCEDSKGITLIQSEKSGEKIVKQEDIEEYEVDFDICDIDIKTDDDFVGKKIDDSRTRGHLIPEVPCEICQKGCRGLKMLKSHMQKEHGDIELFVCSDCDLVFRSKAMMEMHQELAHNSTPSEIETMKKQCFICEQSFFAKKMLGHLKNCEKLAEEMKDGCSKCGKVFDIRGKHARSTWQHHIKKCQFLENQKSILCELCGKSCAGKKANKDHMIEFHTGDLFQKQSIYILDNMLFSKQKIHNLDQTLFHLIPLI